MRRIFDNIIIISDLVLDNSGEKWIFDCDCNCLERVNDDGNVNIVCSITEEKIGYRNFGAIVKKGDLIILSRLLGRNFYCINVKTGKYKKIGTTELDALHDLKSFSGFAYKDNVYFLSAKHPEIAVYNSDFDEFSYLSLSDITGNKVKKNFFSMYAEMSENKLLIPLYDGSGILAFDLDSLSFETMLETEYNGTFSSVIKMGNGRFVLCDREKAKIVMFEREGDGKYGKLIGESANEKDVLYNRLWNNGNEIYLVKENGLGMSRVRIIDTEIKLEDVNISICEKGSFPIVKLIKNLDNVSSMENDMSNLPISDSLFHENCFWGINEIMGCI